MSKNKNRYRQENDLSDPPIEPIDDFDDFNPEVPETTETPAPEPVEAPIPEPASVPVDPVPSPIPNQPIKETTMPTVEVKHQETAPATPAANPTEIVAPKRTAVVRFNELAQKYINVAKAGVKTDEQKKAAVAVLSDIVYLVTTSHDKAVFDACFSFFLRNRAIMLSTQTVMGNVTHFADQTKINRIVQFYVVFISLVEAKVLRKRYSININHVRDVFNNRQLADWLITKR